MRTRSHRRVGSAALAVILALTAGGAAPGSAAGPHAPAEPLLELPRPFIADQPVLQLGAASAEVVPAGRWWLTATYTMANTWAHSRAVEPFLAARGERAPVTVEELRALEPVDTSRGIFYLDGEIQRLELSARRGLGRGLEVGLTLPVLASGGGRADPIVEPFHQTIGHDDNGREWVPRGDYTVYVRSDLRPELFTRRSPGIGLGDLRLTARARLPAVAGWRLALRGVLELPTGDRSDLYGSGDLDLGLQLLADHPLGGGHLHLGVGGVWSGGFDALGLPSQLLVSGLLAYQHPLGRRSSVFAQLTAAQSPLEPLGLVELGRESYLLDLGWRLRLASGRTLVVAASENNFTFQSSMDFGLHLGVTDSF